jgi:hypothetical protein
MDFLASFAALVGQKVPSTDSQNLLNAFLGKTKKGRSNLVIEASTRLAFRSGDWVMIPPYKGATVAKEVNVELGNSTDYQLYNLKSDLGEKNNLAKSNPKKVEQLVNDMKQIVGDKYNFNAHPLELK